MSAPKVTDTHIVTQKLVPGTNVPHYGCEIFSVINKQSGEEVERVAGYTAALAAQAKWNAFVAANGAKV